MRRAVLKAYAQKPDREMVVTYELSEDRLICRSEIATTDLLWRPVRRVLRTPCGFMLYMNEQSVHWLPVRGFQDEKAVESFAEFASANLQGYEDVAKGKSKSGKAPLISKQAKKYLIIWLAAVMFLLLFMSAPNGNRYGHLMAQSMMTHGNVSKTFPGDTLTIRYQYEADGCMFQGQGPVGPPNKSVAQLAVGDPLEVYYDPANPNKSAAGKPGPILLRETGRVAQLAFLLPTFFMGIYFLSFSRRSNRR